VLLRIEDVDIGRARDAFVDSLREDLQWLGCDWDEEVPRQSRRDYRPWLDRLADRTYRCQCSRRQRKESRGRCPCAQLDLDTGAVRFRLEPASRPYVDRRHGRIDTDLSGFEDPVLRRSDGIYTYNLAVVADDIHDGVTEVVRGSDLLHYTGVQIQLWRAFGATPPSWLHTPVVVGPDGRKLSKSHGDIELRALRDRGWSAARIWSTVLPWLGIHGIDTLRDAVASFDPSRPTADEICWISDSET